MGSSNVIKKKFQEYVGIEDLNEKIENLNHVLDTELETYGNSNISIIRELSSIQQNLAFIQKNQLGIDKSNIIVHTEHPVANESMDNIHPRGAKNDNTRYLRFIRKSEEYFGKKIKMLDLGCAGGGLVWDFLNGGHFAIGLEGSDYPKKMQRGFWPVIPSYLLTCNIVKPFVIKNEERKILLDIISLWEVFEHVNENDLPQLLENIKNHLDPDGLLLASVATFEDWDLKKGIQYHVTIKDKKWWENILLQNGFELIDSSFETLDFPRGSGNGVDDWSAIDNPEMGFHIVAKVK